MPKPGKKEAFNPFKSRARAHSTEPPDTVRDEDIQPGEFRDTKLTFVPAAAKQECSLTIEFRCTTKIVRGDTIVIRLAGFKGLAAGVFTLEKRPHPEEEKDFCQHFHAYWAGEAAPKGGPPSQSITLLCRKKIPENAKVVIGVPDAVHIALPDKLAQNSPKLKIEGIVRHAAGGGKIPKAPIESCTEIKKKPLDDDIAEVERVFKELQGAAALDEEELQFVHEMTPQEVDQIWENCRDVSDLKLGLCFKTETAVFQSYEEHAPLAKILTENFLGKKRTSLALHKELAANLGVKVGALVVLEDALFARYGCYYFSSDLSRAAVMVLRLYTCEAHDIARLFGLVTSICIYRELGSAIRTMNNAVLSKWTNFLGVLSTCCSKLTHIAPEMIPVLYRGIKDLPADSLQHLLSLKKDDWYLFPNFTTYVTEARYTDENFSVPDNAVLFEIHGAVDGVEVGDISMYPEDQEWMLPMFSSFSVVSVEVIPDRNHLTRVVLRMRGSLAGALRDELFPEEHRSLSSVVIKRAKTECSVTGEKTLMLTKMIKTSIKLQGLKCLAPQHLSHQQYQERYAEVARVSQARLNIEEHGVRWQQCTQEPVANPDGTLKPATWENLPKNRASTLETLLLRTTRAQKQFTADGVTVDFKEYTADFGKGPRRIRRLVGKRTIPTHPYAS